MRRSFAFALFALVLTLLLVLFVSERMGTVASESAAPISPMHTRAPDAPYAGAQHVRALEERLTSLTMEVQRISEELNRLRGSTRASAGPASPTEPIARNQESPSPSWYLEQYVLSFAEGGVGSEYFRLAVDAYSSELLGQIEPIIFDTAAHAALRAKLIEMLGNLRFTGSARVTGILLRVLRSADDETRAKAALRALKRIGDAGTGRALENIVFALPWSELRNEALGLAIRLAGDRANAALAQLILRAPDEETRVYLIALAQQGPTEFMLDLFRTASVQEVPVRLVAAEKIGEFHDPGLLGFVEEWLGYETDRAVRAKLERSRKKISEVPKWHAMRTTGPPDCGSDPNDENAWATKSADMGTQWLELTYAPPLRAHTIRIFEHNVPGAVASVTGIDASGSRHALWTGNDPTTTVPGPFEISFTTTSYTISKVVLTLDTSRRSGWNEIDAVELVGPSGRGWAVHARASSTYGR